jgi:hypothetical protein
LKRALKAPLFWEEKIPKNPRDLQKTNQHAFSNPQIQSALCSRSLQVKFFLSVNTESR